MKKFTQVKENLERQKSFKAKVCFEIITRATSDSEAAEFVKKIADAAKATNRYITGYEVTEINEEMVNFPDFANENTLAVTNTEKMMMDYLGNNGATKMDKHYVNLEKMLKIFQTGSKKGLKLESKADINVDQMTNDLEDIRADELADSIEAVEAMIKDYKEKEGDVQNQQYHNLEHLKKVLVGYKKHAK